MRDEKIRNSEFEIRNCFKIKSSPRKANCVFCGVDFFILNSKLEIRNSKLFVARKHMSYNAIADKSFKFAVRIVNLRKYLIDSKKEFVMSKQLLRCGTSIGANIAEAEKAQSTADFFTQN